MTWRTGSGYRYLHLDAGHVPEPLSGRSKSTPLLR